MIKYKKLHFYFVLLLNPILSMKLKKGQIHYVRLVKKLFFPNTKYISFF